MSVTKREIEDFFSDYAKALSARDIRSLVRYWGVPGLVLSDEGAIPVAKLDEVEAL